jgi:molecular chaperone DnaJ
VLGVPRDATDKQIRDAFRGLALKYHPDRNKAPEAQEKFKEIAGAYAVLSDPDKRRDYDRHGFAGVAGFSEEDLFRNVDFADLFGGLNFDFPGMDMSLGGGLFERFFGRRRGEPRRGENIDVQLSVPLERVARGGEEKLHYARPVTCVGCHGSGAKAGTHPRPCATCSGSGRLTRESRQRRGKGEVRVQNITVCPDCDGAGTVIDQPCPQCGGRGQVEREETLTVNVPVGVEEGMALRIPGHGLPSQARGGAPGDLFVIVHSAPDPRFQRAGADLWRSETLSVAEAALGTKRRVPTLEADVEVTIPPGTQPDAVLRLAGKGLPEFGGRTHGDLFLRLTVLVPQRLSAEQRALYERLQCLERANDTRGAG